MSRRGPRIKRIDCRHDVRLDPGHADGFLPIPSRPLTIALSSIAAARGFLALRQFKAPRRKNPDPGAEARNTYGLPDGERLRKLLARGFRLQDRNLRPHLDRLAVDLDNPQPLPDLEPGSAAIARAAVPVLTALWDDGGREAEVQLGLSDVWDVKDPNVRTAIERSAFAFADSTNRTTTLQIDAARDRLRREIAEGLYERGETLPQLRKRVQSVFTQATRYRAETIAQTEASRALHAGILTSYAQSGVVAGVQWLVSSDACSYCLMIAAEVNMVRLGDAFAIIGDHPQYSNIYSPPAHVRCRCSLLSVLKSEYGGPENPEWSQTLVQPDPGAIYAPRRGVTVPEPDPDRRAAGTPVQQAIPLRSPATSVLPGRPIAERLAAYEAGDRHLAGIRELETPLRTAETTRRDALARLEAASVQLDAVAREIAGATDPGFLGSLKDEYRQAEKEQATARDEANRLREKAHALLRETIGAANPQKWEHSGSALENPRTARLIASARAFLEPLVESYPVNKPSKLGWETDEKLKRPFYRPGTAAVHIPVWDTPSTAVHEWGHHLENAFPGIGRQAKLYLEHRVGDEKPKPMGAGYGKDEVGRDDDFGRYFDATKARYVGKVYGNAAPTKAQATEMLSMFLEALHRDPIGFVAADPEAAKWTVGILTGELR